MVMCKIDYSFLEEVADTIKRFVNLVSELSFECLPYFLGRVEFGAIGWQKQQGYILWYSNFFSFVKSTII